MKINEIISVAILLVSLLTMCATTPKFSVKGTDNKKHYMVNEGDLFIVELEAQLLKVTDGKFHPSVEPSNLVSPK